MILFIYLFILAQHAITGQGVPPGMQNQMQAIQPQQSMTQQSMVGNHKVYIQITVHVHVYIHIYI